MTMTATVWTPVAPPGAATGPTATAGEEAGKERVEFGHTILRDVDRYLLKVLS
ncbi:MAG: hypothetical protein JO153_01545 [Solirubrobacterales bacterium]|nr:hypothetical protein [Solirubrobacterales bacterium]MBV9915156.1 hypothetical protein [Solirubrobacterales bacterium]